MDNRQKVINLIGLATKAGKTVSGEFSTEKAVKSKKAYLVMVSKEASDNTKKMFTNMCTYYKVPICYFGKKDELGHAMGKEMRASLAVVDKSFAEAIVKQMNTIGGALAKPSSTTAKDALSSLPIACPSSPFPPK